MYKHRQCQTKIWSVLLVLLVLAMPGMVLPVKAGADIYKCVDAKGKVRFSQDPCGKNAVKVELKNSSAGVNFAGEENWDNIKYSNKAREINRELSIHKEALEQLKEEKLKTIAELKYRKQYAAKNIAGQRYEKNLENEIKNKTKEYNNKISAEQNEIKNLERELETNWK